MIIDNEYAKNRYNKYSNVNAKISNEIKKGNLYKIKKGKYETSNNIPCHYLASSLYGPSYISFDFALSYYGFIPERVTTVTCATFGKKKKKKFNTTFGVITYRDVPNNVYSYGVKLYKENNYSFQMAIPEKALCDKLYTLSPVHNLIEIKNMLFNDLRIDKEMFKKLDLKIISDLNDLYHCTNVKFLYKYMRRNNNE